MEFTDGAAPHVGCAANSLAHILWWDVGMAPRKFRSRIIQAWSAMHRVAAVLFYFFLSKRSRSQCLFVFLMFLFFDQNIQFEDFVIFVLTCIHFEDYWWFFKGKTQHFFYAGEEESAAAEKKSFFGPATCLDLVSGLVTENDGKIHHAINGKTHYFYGPCSMSQTVNVYQRVLYILENLGKSGKMLNCMFRSPQTVR